jgi:hypothetical protein
MSQSWLVPILAGDKVSAALLSKTNDALEALRTLHAGAAAPSDTVAFMVYVDTATGQVYQRDSGDAAWNAILATNAKNHQSEPQIHRTGLAGSVNIPLYSPGQGWEALELVVLSDTTTAGSGAGTDWTFNVQNLTAALSLFSVPPSTDVATGSPGEIILGQTWVNLFDQNQSLTANDFLELQITQNGAPTSLAAAELVFGIRGRLLGA